MQESHKRVQWVYESTNDKELEDRYDQWAADYDNDLAAEFAWNAPQNAAAVFTKHVDKSAHVLDAGAGTGLGIITKGPYGLLFPLLFLAIAPLRAKGQVMRRGGVWVWLVFVGAVIAVALVWIVPAWLHDGGGYLGRVLFQPDLTSGSSHHARPPWWYLGPLLGANRIHVLKL